MAGLNHIRYKVSAGIPKRYLVKTATAYIKVIAVLFLSVSLQSCFGPLLSHESARTVGDGHSSFKLITSNAGYGFKFDHGLSENLDIGYSLETNSTGISAKYAFVNRQSGPSFASKIGYGSTPGGHYYLGSFLGSYKGSHWEPYLNLQYIEVTVDENEVKNANTGDVFATTPKFNYDYTQAFVGMKYWFKPRFALSLEVSDFVGHHYVDLRTNIVSLAADFAF